MGFFQTLFGGSEGSSSSQSGFANLPPQIQRVWKAYANQLLGQFPGEDEGDLFTPLPQTDFETNALDMIRRGITPTEDSLRSDISMQMNPFDDFVINDINREAAGDYSVFKGALNEAGQFGSNRQMLGANDIENTRLNMIGRFKQDQYNQALQNSLTTLADSRARDIGLNFSAGDFMRGLDTATKQAPIERLTSFGKLLGVLPTDGGSTSNSSSSSQGGIFESIPIFTKPSDRRLKENITYYDTVNGYKRYKFNYKWDTTTLIGVIAQEIAPVKPEAVFKKGGFYGVDYSQLGFDMEVV